MADEKQTNNRPHNVIMENRKSLSVSGVSDVDSFDEQTVVIYTDMGELTVKGKGLHIDRLNIEIGEIELTGTIYGLMYTDERQKTGFLGRILR